MPQVTLRLENDDKVRLGLNKWGRSLKPLTRAALRAVMKRALKVSPAHRGGNTYAIETRGDYERTGNLGRSTFLVEEGLSFRVQSEAYRDGQPYSEFVIGDGDGNGQAPWHVGRWPTLRSAVEGEFDALTNELDDDVQASAEAVGL